MLAPCIANDARHDAVDVLGARASQGNGSTRRERPVLLGGSLADAARISPRVEERHAGVDRFERKGSRVPGHHQIPHDHSKMAAHRSDQKVASREQPQVLELYAAEGSSRTDACTVSC